MRAAVEPGVAGPLVKLTACACVPSRMALRRLHKQPGRSIGAHAAGEAREDADINRRGRRWIGPRLLWLWLQVRREDYGMLKHGPHDATSQISVVFA